MKVQFCINFATMYLNTLELYESAEFSHQMLVGQFLSIYYIWFFSPAGFHLKTLSNIFNVYSLITCIPVKTKDISAFKLPATEVCVKEELPV